MKYEVTTLNTKKALAASLKRLVAQKPFTKVTVSEIIADCGVNRKTFYYHFADIYALLQWTFEQEAIEIVKQFDLLDEYEQAVYFVMDYIDANRPMLHNLCTTVARSELKRFFYRDFISIGETLVNECEHRLGLHVAEDYKHFLSSFYTEALVGVLLDWIERGDDAHRETTMRYISSALRAALPAALQNGAA